MLVKSWYNLFFNLTLGAGSAGPLGGPREAPSKLAHA